MAKFKGGACSAIIKDDGDTKTIAVLGGWNEFEDYFGEMEVFHCSIGVSEMPVCTRRPNGPRMNRGGKVCRNCEFGCGVLETAEKSTILMAMKWGKHPTEVLDLSDQQPSSWKWHQCEYSEHKVKTQISKPLLPTFPSLSPSDQRH